MSAGSQIDWNGATVVAPPGGSASPPASAGKWQGATVSAPNVPATPASSDQHTFTGHAAAAFWDNLKGAIEIAKSPYTLWDSAISKAKAGDLAGATRDFNQLARGPGAKIADALTDAAKSSASHMANAVSKLEQGDLKGAMAAHDAAAIRAGTILIPHLEQAAHEFEAGNYRAGLGDVAGDATTALMLRAGEKFGSNVPAAVKAGAADVGEGALRLGAGYAAHTAGFPGAEYIGMGAGIPKILSGLKDAVKALVNGEQPPPIPKGAPKAGTPPPMAAATPPPLPTGPTIPPEWDVIAKANFKAPYADLPENVQAVVRGAAAKSTTPPPAASPSIPNAPAAASSATTPSAKPQTLRDSIDAELAARRGESPVDTSAIRDGLEAKRQYEAESNGKSATASASAKAPTVDELFASMRQKLEDNGIVPKGYDWNKGDATRTPPERYDEGSAAPIVKKPAMGTQYLSEISPESPLAANPEALRLAVELNKKLRRAK